MTSRPSSPVRPGRLHPLVGTAAVALIAFCMVGMAALLGWLPKSPAASNAQVSIDSVAEAPVQTPRPAAVVAANPTMAARVTPATRDAACAECGVVETVRRLQVPASDNGNHLIGTVAGGVVGGVVGNQFGGGHGKDALTVLGAVGGALAGREVERNIRQQQTEMHYELTVRMADGSVRSFRSAQPFVFASGDHVRVDNNQLLPR